MVLAVILLAGGDVEYPVLAHLRTTLERGAGFGVRWNSPVGPVRIDLANAISDDETWQLHLNIGPDL